jgi:hypothetical protein
MFWLEDVHYLFSSFDFIPNNEMKYEEKLNTLSRLIILIFLLFYLSTSGSTNSFLFLFLSLSFIIILYYSQRMPIIESYESFTPLYSKSRNLNGVTPKCSNNKGLKCLPNTNININTTNTKNNQPTQKCSTKSGVYTCTNQQKKGNSLQILDNGYGNQKISVINSSSSRFCNDEIPEQFNNPNYIYPSKRLSGGPNPKTLIPPVIAPPITSLDFWKSNNLVTNSAINDVTQEDAFLSGFHVSTDCSDNINNCGKSSWPLRNLPSNTKITCSSNNTENENTESPPFNLQSVLEEDFTQTFDDMNSYNFSDEKQNTATENLETKNTSIPKSNTYDAGIFDSNCWEKDINIACGYDNKQISYGLPSNFASGNCLKNENHKSFNENIFTQIIEPGIYYKSEITEPINSNIGISFTQPSSQTSKKQQQDGIHYTNHDLFNIVNDSETGCDMINDEIDISNVYDPRFYGYGTSYRAYNDPMLGQTRFMYDDINAIKMPNYIVRSEIDNLPFADSYGTLTEQNQIGNEFHSKIRSLAHDSFTRNSTEFRSDLEERLMRKNNVNAWQRKLAPIRTGGQWMSK